MSLKFHSNLVPFLLPTVFHDSLNDPARIVFQNDIFDLSLNDPHQVLHVLLSLRRWYVLLPS